MEQWTVVMTVTAPDPDHSFKEVLGVCETATEACDLLKHAQEYLDAKDYRPYGPVVLELVPYVNWNYWERIDNATDLVEEMCPECFRALDDEGRHLHTSCFSCEGDDVKAFTDWINKENQ